MGLMSWLRGSRSTGAAPHPAAADAPRSEARRDRVDVSRLEPLQRSVTGQDLVIDPRGFQASLTTRQETALGTPLGHLVSPDAPAGLVHGVALAAPGAPAPAVRTAVDMPPRPRSTPAAVQRAYGGGAPALTSAGGSPAAAALPVRQLVGEQPLVQRVEPAEERNAEAGASTRATPEAVQRTKVPPPPEPPRRTPGLGAPLAALPPTAQRQTAHRQADRPTAAQPPVTSPPLVQRESSAPAPVSDPSGPRGSGVREGGTPVVPEALETSAMEEGAGPARVEKVAEPVAPLLGGAPPAVAGAENAAMEPRASGPQERTAPVQRSEHPPGPAPVPPPAPGPTAPLLGERPLSLRNATGPTDQGPAGVAAVQRSAAYGGAQEATPADGPSMSPPDTVPVRWITPGPGTASGLPSAAPLRRAVSPVQRQTGGAPSAPRSTARPSDRAAYPTAGSVAVAAGVAQRMADGSVVFGAAPPHGTSRPVVQRDAEIAEEPPPLPEPEPPPVTEPEPETESDMAAGPDSTPAAPDAQTRAGPPTGQGGPPVTDELVRALYGPLSRLLKADLRLERERAGYLINTRH